VSAKSAFDYAVMRVVPRVERGEQINVGVVLHCRTRGFLGARVALDRGRLLALWPGLVADPVELDELERHLQALVAIAAGQADGGPIAQLPAPDRFHWLVAPRSTILQPSAVHSGLCEDPAQALERLFERMVAPLPSR
jgi:hypothetical protein